MDEVLYKLSSLNKIKKAVSQTYNEIDKSNIYHECMELLLDVEEQILNRFELEEGLKEISREQV